MTERSNWHSAPAWWDWALHELGVKERPGAGSEPRVMAYRQLAHIALDGDDSDVPWCAIFVNAALEQSGVRGTRQAMARSFERSPDFVKLSGPALGAVATFWRGSKAGGLGHVGLYRGEAADRIYLLGGNQGDRVSIDDFSRAAPRLGLVGYWWPRAVALPQIGAIPIRAGQPLQPVSVT